MVPKKALSKSTRKSTSKAGGGAGRLRISLTLSGAIALGAYEAGALAALLTGVQAVSGEKGDDPPLAVDSIGGASAGSITAILAARVLTGGLDPVETMRQAWVEKASLLRMLWGGLRSPLDIRANVQMAETLLCAADDPAKIQGVGIWVSMALANLRGLDYKISVLNHDGRQRMRGLARHTIESASYLDWRNYYFTPGGGPAQFLTPSDRSSVLFALASGANEFGFQPNWLNRDRAAYMKAAVANFPLASDGFWYTDGGTIDNEPLGRTMDIANRVDDDMPFAGHERRRLHLLVHPHPDAPPPDAVLDWADEKDRPRFTGVLSRAVSLVRYQSLYQDVLRAEKTNSRILWTQDLIKAIRPLIPSSAEASWIQALQSVIGAVDQDKRSLGPPWRFGDVPLDYGVQPPQSAVTPGGGNLEDVLWQAIRKTTGLEGRNLSGVEAISPLLNLPKPGRQQPGQPPGPPGPPSPPASPASRPPRVDDLLAGELLGSFGGFLDRKLRQSDFLLGYQSTRIWLEDSGLQRYGLGAAEAATVLKAVRDRELPLTDQTKQICLGQTNLGGRSLSRELLGNPGALGSFALFALRWLLVGILDILRRLLGIGNQARA